MMPVTHVISNMIFLDVLFIIYEIKKHEKTENILIQPVTNHPDVEKSF